MSETVCLGKLMEYLTAVLRSVVRAGNFRNALLAENSFENIDDSLTVTLCRKTTDNREFRVIVRNRKIIMAITEEKISAHSVPCSWWDLRWNEWFLCLFSLVYLADAASSYHPLNVAIDAKPVHRGACEEFSMP